MKTSEILQKTVENMTDGEKTEFLERVQSFITKHEKKKERKKHKRGNVKSKWEYEIQHVKHIYQCELCGFNEEKIFTVDIIARKENPIFTVKDQVLNVSHCHMCKDHFRMQLALCIDPLNKATTIVAQLLDAITRAEVRR